MAQFIAVDRQRPRRRSGFSVRRPMAEDGRRGGYGARCCTTDMAPGCRFREGLPGLRGSTGATDRSAGSRYANLRTTNAHPSKSPPQQHGPSVYGGTMRSWCMLNTEPTARLRHSAGSSVDKLANPSRVCVSSRPLCKNAATMVDGGEALSRSPGRRIRQMRMDGAGSTERRRSQRTEHVLALRTKIVHRLSDGSVARRRPLR